MAKTYEYNGDDQGPAGTYTSGFDTYVTVTGLQGTDALTSITLSGIRTEVGIYEDEIVPSAAAVGTNTGNYTISYVEGDLTITASTKELAVVSKPGSWMYDGNAHTKYEYTVTYGDESYDVTVAEGETTGTATLSTGDVVTITPAATATITNVVSTPVVNAFSYSVDNSDQYSNQVKTEDTLKVTPRPLTITVNTHKFYDGTALVSAYDSTGVTISGNVAGEVLTAGKVTTNGSVVDTYTNAANTVTINTPFNITNGISNYDVTYTITMTINSNTKLAMTCPTSQSDTVKVYDGTPISYTVTANVATSDPVKVEYSTDNLHWSTDVPSLTNVGTQPVYVRASANNYDTSYCQYTLKVTRRPVTVTVADANPVVYDGNEHTGVTTYTMGNVADNQTATITYTPAKGTLPGTYTGSFADDFVVRDANNQDVTSNYTLAPTPGKLIINNRTDKYEITVVANSTSTTYDGEQHNATGFQTLTFTVNGHAYTVSGLTTSNPSSTNADTIANAITGTAVVTDAAGNVVTDQFTVHTTDGALEIAKRNITVTVADATDVVYDGNEHTGVATYTFGNVVNGQTATITYTPAQGTVAGTYTGSFGNDLVVKDASDNDVTSNYNLTTATPGKLTITDRTDKYEITVVANSNTGNTYDGTAKSATGFQTLTFTVNGHPYTVSGLTTSNPISTDADTIANAITGTAVVTDAVGNVVTDQFTVHTTDGALEIAKRAITVSVEDASLVYNGTLRNGNTDYTFSNVVSGQTASITYTPSQGTNVSAEPYDNGSFTANSLLVKDASNQDVTANYTLTDATAGKLTITPISGVTVTIVGNHDSHAYDGQPHTVTGYTATADNTLYNVANSFSFTPAAGATLVEGVIAATQQDAGTKYMGLAAAQFANTNPNFTEVTFNVTDGWMTVEPIDVTVTITGATNTANYDGNAHTVTGYTATANTGLYDVQHDFTFNGPTSATRTHVVEGTDADGKTDMGLLASQFTNTNPNFGTVTFNVTDGWQKINPITATVTVIGANNTTDYDGAEHSVNGYTATSSTNLYKVTGENVDFTFNGTAEAARTIVGTTNMGLTAGQFTNTNTDFSAVTFDVTDGYQTINPIDVTVTVTGHYNTTDYDGAAHTVTGFDTTYSTPLYKGTDFTFSGTATATRTDAGTTNMGLAANQFANNNTNFGTVTFNVTDGYQTINPIDVTVTITGHHNTTDYDGAAHTVTGFDTTYSTPLYKGTDFTFSGTATATRTNVVEGTDVDGKTDMGLAASQFTNTNTNFGTVTFNVTDGYQTINPIDVTVTITGHHHIDTYDGNAHTVTGYDVEVSNPLYQTSYFTFNGTAADSTATRTFAGTTYMNITADKFANNNTNFGTVTFNVERGYQTITADNEVVVTITGKTSTLPYDGTAHTVNGYEVSISNPLYTTADFTFSGTASATRTNVVEGEDADGQTNMGLVASQFTNTNTNFDNVTFNVTDGYQKIEPINATVTIVGANNTTAYDGAAHTVNGYTATSSTDLYKVTGDNVDFTFSGTATATRTNVVEGEDADGQTNMGLAASQFTNNNTNFGTVTFNVTDGYQTITPINATVTITGHQNTANYDGNLHTVTGFDTAYSTPLYKGDYFTFSGTATAARTNVVEDADADGTTDMGLAADQFANTNTNFGTVTFNVTDGYQTITPINVTVTITGHTGTKVFNGSEQSVTGYDVTVGNVLYQESYITYNEDSTAHGTAVGTYPMGLAATQFGNTSPNFGTVTFQVTDGSLTITSSDALTITLPAVREKTYDNTPLSGECTASAISGTGTPTLTYSIDGGNTFTSDIPDITDFGTVTVIARASCPNYSAVDSTFTLSITKRAVTLKSDNLTKPYDGYSLVNGTTPLAVESGFVNGQGAAYTFTGSQTNVGSSENTFLYTLNSNTKAANYVVTTQFGMLTVTSNENPLVIQSGSKTWTYDGAEHTYPSYTVTYNGNPVAHIVEDSTIFVLPTMDTLRISGPTGVTNYTAGVPNAYTYEVENQSFYTNITALKGTVAISKRPVTLTGETNSLVYNGTEQSITGITADNLVSGHTWTISYAAKGTDVGTYNGSFSGTNKIMNGTTEVTDNYTVTLVPGTLTITQNTTPIVITAASDNKTYDGSALTNNGYTYTEGVLLTGDVLTATVSGTITHVGTAANRVTGWQVKRGTTDVTANYTFGTPVDGTLEVTKRTVTLTSATDSKTYDGSALTNSTVTVGGDGFATAEGATYDVTGSQLDAGYSANAFTYTLNANTQANDYTITTTEGTLTVNPLSGVTVTITGNHASNVYDGSEHSVNGYTGTASTDLYDVAANVAMTGAASAARIDVGTTYMGLVSTQFSNTNDNFTNVTFTLGADGYQTITPVTTPIVITAASDNKTYDGSALTNDGYIYTEGVLLTGDVLTATVVGTITDVGSEANRVTYWQVKRGTTDVTANYTFGEAVDGTLIITPRTVTVSVSNKTVEYNGSEQYGNTDYTFSNVVAGQTASITYTPSEGTLVNTYDNGAYDANTFTVMSGNMDVTPNYTLGTQTAGKLTITNRTTPYAITVVANSSTDNVYDGTTKSVSGFETLTFTVDGNTYTVDGLTTSDPSSANVCNLTNAISGTAVVKDGNGNDVTAQFNVTAQDGTLAITPRIVHIATASDSKLFDGTPLTNPNYTITGDGFVNGEVTNIHTTGTVTDINTCEDNTIEYTPVANVFIATNYTIDTTLGQLCITGSNRPITITSASANGLTPTYDVTAATPITYDGTTHGDAFKLYRVTYDDAVINADAGSNGLVFTLPTGDKLTVTPTFTGVTNVADANNTDHNNSFTYAITNGGVNVDDAYVGEMTITAGTVKLKPSNLNIKLTDSKIYDGTKLVVTVPANLGNGTTGNWIISGLANGEYITAGTVETESYHVGEYLCEAGSFNYMMALAATQSGFDVSSAKSNYAPKFDVKLSISERTLTITANSATKVYDGTVLTETGFSVSGSASTDVVTATTSGSQLCSGESENVISDYTVTHNGEDVTGDYTITTEPGLLKVIAITDGFACPGEVTLTLTEGTSEMTVTDADLNGPATLTPANTHTHVGNNLSSLNPLGVGDHWITWTLYDDCDSAMTTCSQKVTVQYAPCEGTITMASGHEYTIKRIGSQCWFTENLREEVGDHHAYKDLDANLEKFGYLYSWYTTVGVPEGNDNEAPTTYTADNGTPYVQGICPAGWSVGSVEDYHNLDMYAGSASLLKDPSTQYWFSGYEGVAGGTGFNARGGGWYKSSVGHYEDLMTGYHFWQSDAMPGSNTVTNWSIPYYCDSMVSETNVKSDRKSVRCIRKQVTP